MEFYTFFLLCLNGDKQKERGKKKKRIADEWQMCVCHEFPYLCKLRPTIWIKSVRFLCPLIILPYIRSAHKLEKLEKPLDYLSKHSSLRNQHNIPLLVDSNDTKNIKCSLFAILCILTTISVIKNHEGTTIFTST